MSGELRQYYLQQMGIETWLHRAIICNTAQDSNLSDLTQLAHTASTCTQCPLHKSRTQTVFARGNPSAKLMIVGEAPGFHEDQQGLPFVGKAGALLNKMLKSVGYAESDVYIANVLKCRPPNNRDPQEEEIQQCSGYLAQQIALIKPSLILAVGRFAGQFLLNSKLSLGKMRNNMHSYQGTRVLVSYHPAYLLRNPADKKKAYQDLLLTQKWMNELSNNEAT
jgi:uracil-DNA glycosylase family 4